MSDNLKLGAFSLSLNVKDIHASKAFYETLGFIVFGGNIEQNWLILKNGSTLIGLFQGMFDNNMMTFNPGWDQNASEMDEFDDIRKIYQHLKSNEMEITPLMDENNQGPAYFTVTDPDGNQILFDQHR